MDRLMEVLQTENHNIDAEIKRLNQTHNDLSTEVRSASVEVERAKAVLEEKMTKQADASKRMEECRHALNNMVEKKHGWSSLTDMIKSHGGIRDTTTGDKVSAKVNQSSATFDAGPAAQDLPDLSGQIANEKSISDEVHQDQLLRTSLSGEYPTVVNLDGDWHELACFVCGTNIDRGYKLLNGFNGFSRHMADEHRDIEGDKEDIVRRCSIRIFDARDILQMLQGKNPESGSIVLRYSRMQEPEPVVRGPITKALGPNGHEKNPALVVKLRFPVQEGAVLHPDYPHIVYNKGEWIALSCRYCGANSNIDGTFFVGWKGLSQHILSFHPDVKNELQQDRDLCWAHCKTLVVNPQNVENLQEGKPPVDPIKKIPPFQNTDSQVGKSNPNQDNLSIFPKRPLTSAFKGISSFEKRKSQSDVRGNGPQSIHPAFPYVVTFQSKDTVNDDDRRAFFYISCNIKSCNANAENGRFFDGVQGLQTHVRTFHDLSADANSSDRWCKLERVEQRDVIAMRDGLPPFKTIRMFEGNLRTTARSTESLTWDDKDGENILKRSAEDRTGPVSKKPHTSHNHQFIQAVSDTETESSSYSESDIETSSEESDEYEPSENIVDDPDYFDG